MSEKSELLPDDRVEKAEDLDKPTSPGTNTKDEFLKSSKILENVNKDLLVSKFAFFFFFMAMGAYLPYLGVFYKQLWLNARQSGVLLGIRPFIKMLCSPLWGMVTDVCNKPKWILLLSILGAMVAHFCQSVVSPFSLPCYPETNGTIDGLNYSNTQTAFPPYVAGDEPSMKNRRQFEISSRRANDPDRANIKLIFNLPEQSTFRETTAFDAKNMESVQSDNEKLREGKLYHKGGQTGYSNIRDGGGDKDDIAHSDDREERKKFQKEDETEANFKDNSLNADIKSTEIPSTKKSKAHTSARSPQSTMKTAKEKKVGLEENNKPFITKSKKRTKPLDPSNDFRIVDNQHIFVTLMVIVILGEVVASPAPMLTDSGTLELLSGRENYYGRQRLFGSIGWGLGSLFSGAIVAALNTCPYSDAINYVACFYVYAVAMLFDFITCFFFKFKNGERPAKDVLADKGFLHGLKIFANLKNSGFIITLFFLGYLHSVQLSFLFWFLQDIGGTPLLFTLILTFNALSEVLMFFVATNLVQKLGNDVVLYIGIGCYGIRFLMYSYLENPWFVLPLEVLQGFTYGGVWTASVSYVGPQPGSGATVQGILHGVYWGLGMAIGGVLGGFMVHGIGARMTFRIDAACAFAVLFLFFGVNNIDQHRHTYSAVPAEPGHETEEDE